MPGFSKSERITSKITIDALFSGSQNVFSFPIKAYFAIKNKDAPTQVLISVPKRIFKKAVDRNRIKRLLRESYRKNKVILSQLYNNNLQIAFVYIHKEILTYIEIEKKMAIVLNKILAENKKITSEIK